MKYIPTLLFITSLGGVASAATLTQTQSFAFVPNGSQSLTFNKFDSSLGTLVSVTVSVVLNKTGGSFEIDNDSTNSGTLNFTHSVIGSLSVVSGGVALIKNDFSSIGSSGTLTASSSLNNQSVAPTVGDSTSTFNSTGLGDNVVFNPGNSSANTSGTVASFAQSTYQGTGTFQLGANALQSVEVTGLGGLQQSFTVSSVAGDVTINYEYISAIPEPSSALLGGLGFIYLLRRRRR